MYLYKLRATRPVGKQTVWCVGNKSGHRSAYTPVWQRNKGVRLFGYTDKGYNMSEFERSGTYIPSVAVPLEFVA